MAEMDATKRPVDKNHSRISYSERQRLMQELRARKEQLQAELASVSGQLGALARGVPFNEDDLQMAIYEVLAKHPEGVLGFVGIRTRIHDRPGLPSFSLKDVREWVKKHPESVRKVGAKYFLPS